MLVLVLMLSLTWHQRVLGDPRVRIFTEWKSLSDKRLDLSFQKVENTFSEKPRSVLIFILTLHSRVPKSLMFYFISCMLLDRLFSFRDMVSPSPYLKSTTLI